MARHPPLVVLQCVIGLVLAGPAAAQTLEQTSLQIERFRAPIDHHGFGTTEGGHIADHLEFQGGVVMNYAYNPLVLNGADGRVSSLLAHRVGANVLATIGLFDYVSLGVDVPVVLYQAPGGETALYERLGIGSSISSFGGGDLKLVPKIRILRDDRHFVSLALIPAFTLPTAVGLNVVNGFSLDYEGSYLGEGPLGFSFLPEAVLSTNQYGVRASANLQWRLRRQVDYLGAVAVTPDLTYRLGLGYDFGWLFKNVLKMKYPDGLLVYGELFGATTDVNPFGITDLLLPATEEEEVGRARVRKLNNHLEVSAGLRYHVWAGVHVEAGMGTGLFNGYGSPDFRTYGGVRYVFERNDKDGDGIEDDVDACPEEAEDKDQFQDSDGCPDNDNDDDGLPDNGDACPMEPEDIDGFEDGDGCPEVDNDKDGTLDDKDRCPTEPGPEQNQGCPISDRDEDGIKDAEDACPDEKGPPDRQGCPFKDRDQDGVEDKQDKCPDEKGLPERQGCPVPDKDKDGVEDAQDKCPDVPGPVERQGCPLNDKDLDGVIDEEDKCPTEAGPATRQGCPIPDKDGDGVEDKDDKCPTEAGPPALQGCPDKDGDGVADKDDLCPEVPGQAQFRGCGDRDHDGIPDNLDKCPDEPEIINGVKDDDGCPDQGKVVVILTKEKIEISEKVFFQTARDTIQRKSFSLLDQVALVLKAHPEIKKVRVEGHTDSQGSDELNKDLSNRRAVAVKIYLMKAGIDPLRLDAVGFGEERPIADNGTPEGRAENRRVEFVIVEQEGAPAP